MNIARKLCQRLIPYLVLLFLACPLTSVNADEIRPALLDIKETSPGWFDVTWKIPAREGKVLAITPKLPENLIQVGLPLVQSVPGAVIKRFTFKSSGEPLTGETIYIEGLSRLQSTDVLLQIQLQDKRSWSLVLQPGSSFFKIPKQSPGIDVAVTYWRMGVIHILEGMDHLLFVLALLLIVGNFRSLVKAITAFTVAHSITLAMATLNLLRVPSAPTEAIISLSIVFLAIEIIRKRQGDDSVTERYPWIVALFFGLFHGLGFAGALAEIGVPQHAVPLALLMFNIGVETGQILFVIFVSLLIWGIRQIPVKIPQTAGLIMPYVIGSIAAFWSIERFVTVLYSF